MDAKDPRERRRDDVDLTIVIPCLNEEENIEHVLSQVRAVQAQPFASEIIVVDDISDDRTVALARAWMEGAGKDCRVSLVQRPLRRRGYGAVVRYGVAQRPRPLLHLRLGRLGDPIQLIPQMYEKLESGCTLARCSRCLKASSSMVGKMSTSATGVAIRAPGWASLGVPPASGFDLWRRVEELVSSYRPSGLARGVTRLPMTAEELATAPAGTVSSSAAAV